MLSIFERFDSSNSTIGIVFPWLRIITPAYLLRMALGTMLYMTLNTIVNERKKTGRREDDALQHFIDRDTRIDVINKVSVSTTLGATNHRGIEEGANSPYATQFQINATWAALMTTSASGTWLLIILASNPEWKDRGREEVDRATAKHRANAGQSASDILDTLTLDEWESEFPILRSSLREAVRVALAGALFRKNTSGGDIAIGETGEVVPDGSYATYLIDEVHMDPSMYPDPLSFDPDRYLGKADVKQETRGYVGWGSGLHPCREYFCLVLLLVLSASRNVNVTQLA
jgi:sterol 14-demethylase